MIRRSSLALLGGFLLAGTLATSPAWSADVSTDPKPTREQIAFFEKSIRPVLVKECYGCHSTGDKIKGGLVLDSREGLRTGGESGPAIVPGDAKKSLLVQALRHSRDAVKMPPKKKLPDEVVADFEKWIDLGAPDPREAAVKVVKTDIDIEKGRHYWAFRPPLKATPPTVKDTTWPRSGSDRFLLAGLEAKGLKPVADAEARALLRRVYFDLIGLAPRPDEVESFVRQHATGPDTAFAEVVDHLLASPQFGERWGRHWLDVARYGESSGRTTNLAYPHAWRYRDWVIAAFNADKPYDQFIREQLAGDLLSAKDDREKADLMVATGFLAIGPKSHNERNRRQFQMDLADEQIDATFQAFQGLTVACARCHDHKFDPIPQKDYYALSGIFQSTETCYGTIRLLQSTNPSLLLTLPAQSGAIAGLEPLTEEKRTAINQQIDEVKDRISKLTGQNTFIQRILLNGRISVLQSQLALYEADGTPKRLAMGVRDREEPTDSRLYIRGELTQGADAVPRGIPQVLTTKQPSITKGSGRRELADWIASRDNPLTARVMANRVWLHLMGRGLVPTPDNFGASGQPASNPQLLDFLAASFADNGWSVKKLIRSIVLSRAYQLSSVHDDRNFAADPDNVLAWRMPRRRLEAEAVRDSMLAVAGRLDLSPAKGSPITVNGEGNANFRVRGGRPAERDMTEVHRSVYLAIVRDSVPEMLTLFDFPDPSLIIGERATTTVPAQALYLLNNPFVLRQAEALADRLLDAKDAEASLTRAYELCYARPPSEKERRTARNFLEEYGRKHSQRETWTALCQSLFASAEFSSR